MSMNLKLSKIYIGEFRMLMNLKLINLMLINFELINLMSMNFINKQISYIFSLGCFLMLLSAYEILS